MRGLTPQPLLLGGKISLTGTTLVGDNSYIAREVPLSTGDIVIAEDASSIISLLLRVDSESGVQLIGRVEAPTVKVASFFGAERSLVLSFLHKVTNDPLMTALWSLAGLLVAVLGFIGIKPSLQNNERDLTDNE